jgi:hypothetical protein
MAWGDALSRILAKIDDVLESPDITVAQERAIESISDTVRTVFSGIREAAHTDDYDRLLACVDRLREEIVIAEALLDRLLKPAT